MEELQVSIDEVLRYLGYRGQDIEEDLLKKIREIIEESKKSFRPKVIYSIYEIEKKEEGIAVKGTNLLMEGKDIRKLLKDSEKIYLMAVTLGNDIERLTRKYEKISMRDALILDACATTAIEEYADKIQDKIKIEELKKGESFTFRYSPGYGDLGLGVQRDIVNILNCERRIGLKVSERMLLFPRKSVTAILGIIKGKEIKRSCKNCKNYSTCIYRKEGDVSGCS